MNSKAHSTAAHRLKTIGLHRNRPISCVIVDLQLLAASSFTGNCLHDVCVSVLHRTAFHCFASDNYEDRKTQSNISNSLMHYVNFATITMQHMGLKHCLLCLHKISIRLGRETDVLFRPWAEFLFLPSGVRHVKNIYSFRLFTWETEIRPSCPEDGCSISLRNVGNHLAEFRVLPQPEIIKIRTGCGNE
jgi:hypothetical protein